MMLPLLARMIVWVPSRVMLTLPRATFAPSGPARACEQTAATSDPLSAAVHPPMRPSPPRAPLLNRSARSRSVPAPRARRESPARSVHVLIAHPSSIAAHPAAHTRPRAHARQYRIVSEKFTRLSPESQVLAWSDTASRATPQLTCTFRFRFHWNSRPTPVPTGVWADSAGCGWLSQACPASRKPLKIRSQAALPKGCCGVYLKSCPNQPIDRLPILPTSLTPMAAGRWNRYSADPIMTESPATMDSG